MGAITNIVATGEVVPFPSATPGGMVAEIWRATASTAGDTQTITSLRLRQILYVIGPVSYTVLGGANVAALTTLATIAASNFTDFLVIGYPNL